MEEVEFDPVKNEENLRARGLPLDAAILLFDGPYVEEQDTRRD